MYRTKFVRDSGTGLKGSGIESGARMHVTAVTSPIRTSVPVLLCEWVSVVVDDECIIGVKSFLCDKVCAAWKNSSCPLLALV